MYRRTVSGSLQILVSTRLIEKTKTAFYNRAARIKPNSNVSSACTERRSGFQLLESLDLCVIGQCCSHRCCLCSFVSKSVSIIPGYAAAHPPFKAAIPPNLLWLFRCSASRFRSEITLIWLIKRRVFALQSQTMPFIASACYKDEQVPTFRAWNILHSFKQSN